MFRIAWLNSEQLCRKNKNKKILQIKASKRNNDMMELKLLRQLKNEPYSEYQLTSKISVKDLKRMYGIYQKYYANTSYEIFETDFLKKTGVFLIREPKNKHIVGFSTILERDFLVDGKAQHAFFSGDTIIEQEYWGSRALQRAMYRYIVAYKFRHPFNPAYWILISKGFKTYLLLANNYYSYYPHYGDKNNRLEEYVTSYCEQYFKEYYDPKTGLINFGNDYQPLKGEVAPITKEMRQKNQKIEFFENKNPTWEDGTELPCIGEITWFDMYRYVERFLSKLDSKGRGDTKKKSKPALHIESSNSNSKVA